MKDALHWAQDADVEVEISGELAELGSFVDQTQLEDLIRRVQEDARKELLSALKSLVDREPTEHSTPAWNAALTAARVGALQKRDLSTTYLDSVIRLSADDLFRTGEAATADLDAARAVYRAEAGKPPL